MTTSADLAAPANRRIRHRGRAVVTALVVVALVVTAIVLQHWRNGLRSFEPSGDILGAKSWTVGRPIYVPILSGKGTGPVTAHLDSARANVAVNTAEARVSLVLCRLAPRTELYMGASSTRSYCTSTEPFRAGTFRICQYNDGHSGPEEMVVLKIVPRRLGKTVVRGIDVSYSQGFRRGAQLTGLIVSVHTVRT